MIISKIETVGYLHGFRFDLLRVDSTKIRIFESDACSLKVNVRF